MVFLLGLLTAVATVPAIHRSASAFHQKAGPWAALFWSIGCNDLVLQGNQPNAEAFMNLFTAWAFAVLADWNRDFGGWRKVALAGCLLAAASVYKQVIVYMCLPLALLLVTRAKTWRESLGLVSALALPGVLAWAAIAAGFALDGSFEDFWLTVFVHSRHYSGSLMANLIASISLSRIESMLVFRVLIFLATLTTFGLLGSRRDGKGELWLILASWLVGTHLAIVAPGHFWPHYYQLWLPPLCVGAGCGLMKLMSWIGRERPVLVPITGLLAIALLLRLESPLLRLDSEGYSQFKFDSKCIGARELGRNLGHLLNRDESFYVWGPEPGLFFYSQTRPLTGVLWDDPLFDSVISPILSKRTLHSLKLSRPELVVVYKTQRNARVMHPILEWVQDEYRLLPRTTRNEEDGPEFFIRKGGRLERRIPDLDWEDLMGQQIVTAGSSLTVRHGISRRHLQSGRGRVSE